MNRFSLAVILFLCFSFPEVTAQTVADAEKMIRYERFVSARQLLEKITTKNPADVMAWYWLGQTSLLQPQADLSRAKAVFQSGLKVNKDAPVLLAAIGHTELLGKNKEAAKQQFSTALQKAGSDPEVIKAMARANMDGQFYGPGFNREEFKRNVTEPLEKLPLTDGETCLLLAKAWRILMETGKTIDYLYKAENMPQWKAAAYYQAGTWQLTIKNPELAAVYFEQTVSADPAYAPAWLQLQKIHTLSDFDKAKNALDKYIANTDVDCNNEIYYASFLNLSRHYAEALIKLDAISKGDCRDSAVLRYLQADCHFKLNDFSAAQTAMDDYLRLEKKERLSGAIYAFAGQISISIPGNERKAMSLYEQAANTVTDDSYKQTYLAKMLEIARKIKDWNVAFAAAEKRYKQMKTPSNIALFDYAQEAYNAGRYPASDSLYSLYISRYPEQHHGYYGRGNTRAQLDQDMSKGLAIADYENFVKIAGSDKPKYKNQLLKVYGYLGTYYVNIKKDKANGLLYLNEYLALDPSNEQVKKVVQQLKQ